MVISSPTGPISRRGGTESVHESHGKRYSLCLRCVDKIAVLQDILRMNFYPLFFETKNEEFSWRRNRYLLESSRNVRDRDCVSVKPTTNSDTQDQS